jgi:uncharacterized phage-associated protein
MADAINVALFFLQLADAEDEPEKLSHLRLQKLLYYAQGWSLALRDTVLFSDRIEAWAHGPVVPSVYPSFASYGNGVIPVEVFPFDSEEELEKDDRELIEAVWNAYKPYSALSLREMTHKEPPWRDARGDSPPGERCKTEISVEAMKKYFSRIAKKGRAKT